MSVDEKRVQEFAYQIWESEGRPEGQEARHWEMAWKLAEAEGENATNPPKRTRKVTKPEAAPAAEQPAAKKPRATKAAAPKEPKVKEPKAPKAPKVPKSPKA